MSIALRTKLRYHSAAPHFFRLIRPRPLSDDGRHSDYPPEPIPDRPLRTQSPPPRRSRQPRFNRVRGNENPNFKKSESDAEFLERFKLGLDRKFANPNPGPGDKIVPNDGAASGEPSPAPADADEIFKKMKETGLIPNAVAMLDGLCKDGLVQEAMKLFGLMREKGTIPEVVVYTAVVEGFCKAHKFDDAVRVFRKMRGNGVAPNVFSYQVLIRGLSGGGRLEDAYGFVIEALEAGHYPNLETFTGLIDVYCREKGVEEAQNVIGAMRQKGFSFEEKKARECLDKKGPFSPLVWEAILGNKASKMSIF